MEERQEREMGSKAEACPVFEGWGVQGAPAKTEHGSGSGVSDGHWRR